MAPTQRNLITVLLLCLAATLARAAPEEIQLSFTVFARTPVTGLTYAPSTVTPDRTALKSYATERSPVYHYKGPAALAFYDGEGGAASPPVAIYRVPRGMIKVFLLFSKRATPTSDGLQYDITGIDEGRESLPPGSFLVLNASNVSFAGSIVGSPVTVPPGMTPSFNGTNGTKIFLRRSDALDAAPVVGEDFKVGPLQRVIVVLFPPSSPTGLRPVVRRLLEVLPVDKPKLPVGKKPAPEPQPPAGG